MHHVFEVGEILRLIASCLVYEGREGAVSFACCRKSFSVPTLDTLWGTSSFDLTRVLRTLPRSIWTISRRAFRFLREPSEEEWSRLSVYAWRVRRLTNSGPIILSKAALKLLNMRFSNGCMLPNLREIKWLRTSPEVLGLTLPLVVSPVLTNFRLSIRSRDHTIGAPQLIAASKALTPAYNSLVEIRFCDPTIHDPRIIDTASTILLKCNPEKLRSFHVHSVLSEEAFLHAAQLPNLEAFSVTMDATELEAPLPASMFPSLRSLVIRSTDTRLPLLQAIAHIQSKTFERLTLEFPAATLGTSIPRTLEALRHRSLHQTLSNLTISPEGRFNLDKAFVRPLLLLKELSYLTIGLVCTSPCPYRLSDEDFDGLVKAMPKLESLTFGKFPCSHPANNTIRALASVAKHCKHLKELIIHTNVEAIIDGVSQRENWGSDLTAQEPFSPFVGCPLTNIVFGPCSIPNHQGAAVFALLLLRLFPRLKSVSVSFLTRDGPDPLWQLVDSLVNAYKGVSTVMADAADEVVS